MEYVKKVCLLVGPPIASGESAGRETTAVETEDERDPDITEAERGTDPEWEPKEAERRWKDGGMADATTVSRSFS